MKTSLRFTLVFSALTLVGAPLIGAENQDNQPPPGERPGPGGARGGPRGGGRGGMNMQRLAEQLKLTDEQKAKIEPILKKQQEQVQALRGDQSVPQEQRMGKMRSIMEDTRKQIAAVLTDEQKKKFEGMAARGGPGGSRRGQGGPGAPGEGGGRPPGNRGEGGTPPPGGNN